MNPERHFGFVVLSFLFLFFIVREGGTTQQERERWTKQERGDVVFSHITSINMT
jgi:hypothetical protein